MRFLKVINSINFNFDDEIQLIGILVGGIFMQLQINYFGLWLQIGYFGRKTIVLRFPFEVLIIQAID